MDVRIKEDAVDEAVERARAKADKVIKPIVEVLVLGGALIGGCVAAWKAVQGVADEVKTTSKRRAKRSAEDA